MRAADHIDDTVSAKLLRFFPELAAELGGDPHVLLREVGLDPQRSLGGGGTASYRDAALLLEHTAQALGRPDFGLRLATRQGGDMFGPLGEVMRSAPTFGDALAYVRGHAHAHSLAASIWSRAAEGMVFVGHDILLERTQARVQLLEQILLLGHLAAQEITGGSVRARGVRFRHRAVSEPEVYRRAFRCEVQFSQDEDGVFFLATDLERPVAARDPAAFAQAAGYIDAAFERRPPFHAQVRAIVLQRLNAEPCAADDAAAALGLHPRTLRRRLSAEDTSFQRVKDEVRRDLLLFYLRETDLDLASISAKLGFAEQSVMSRRCQAWYALAPTGLRRRSREACLTP